MQVTVFTTTTCPYCNMLKTYLKDKGILFEEKLVDQDDKAKEEMIANSQGFLGVPFTVAVKDDGTKSLVIGFDKGKINEIFNISEG